MRANRWGRGFLVSMLLMTTATFADTAAATAAFKRAQQFQTAKQWGNAVKEYKAALAADPAYFWAYKGLGTTYYQGGDKRGALGYYDRYLAANPSDSQTKAFAEKLRAEVGGTAGVVGATTAVGKAPAASKPAYQGLSLGVGLLGLMAGADDLNKLLGTGATKTFQGGFGFGLDLGVDYALANGFVMGAKFGYGPNRSHALDFGTGGKVTADVGNMIFSASPGYLISLGTDSWIDARVDLGLMMSTLTFTSTFGSSSVTTKYSGSGFAVTPQVAYVKKFGQSVAGSFGLGYMISSVSPLTDDKGNKYTYSTGTGSPTNFALSSGGLTLRLAFNYFL